MISSMINKYVLLRVFLTIFSMWSFRCIHMIGVYMTYLFLTCVCIQGDFLTIYWMCIIFKRGEILYVRGINFKVIHACFPSSNNECTPHGILRILGVYIYMYRHVDIDIDINILFIINMNIFMLNKWSYRSIQFCWLLRLRWLSPFEHAIRSLLDMCLFGIYMRSHTKPFIT